MLNTITLARPYAKAAYEFAAGAGQADAWTALLALTASAVEDTVVLGQLGNPELSSEQKVALLAQLSEAAGNKDFVNFLHVLGENDRLAILPAIYEAFFEMKEQADRTQVVEVQSAFELSAEQLQTLAAALSKRLDRTVVPQASVNKALLGGLIIRAGDLVIDGSVRGKLNKLAEALKS